MNVNNSHLYSGGIEALWKRVPNDSVDLILTDPPYKKEFLPLYEELAILAQAKLKPGRLCMAYTFQLYTPRILEMMSRHLDYYWMFSVWTPGVTARFTNYCRRTLFFRWKPVVVFTKRPRSTPKLPHRVIQDGEISPKPDKKFHRDGQNLEPLLHWINAITEPGDVVMDPFCGGGATAVAAKMTGRSFITADIDSQVLELARERLNSVEWASWSMKKHEVSDS